MDSCLFGDGEKATVLAEGGLVKDWRKIQRLVVIVACADSHALFVFNAKTLPVTDPSDLSVDNVIPIDGSFK